MRSSMGRSLRVLGAMFCSKYVRISFSLLLLNALKYDSARFPALVSGKRTAASSPAQTMQAKTKIAIRDIDAVKLFFIAFSSP
jgi:hypothetical protein